MYVARTFNRLIISSSHNLGKSFYQKNIGKPHLCIYSKQKDNNKLRLTYVAKVNKKGEEHTIILKVPILGCI